MMKEYANPREMVTVNPACLEYLAKMFVMDRDEVCQRVSAECDEPVSAAALFGSEVVLMHLSALAEVFGKDIGFFIFDSLPEEKQAGSILFRKKKLKQGLCYPDRLLISKIEEEAFRLASLNEDLGVDRLRRKLKRRTRSASAARTAYSVREEMQLRETPYKNARTHLRYLISALGDHNIVVHEHIESSNDKGKLNLAGFFLKPYLLVIKREMSLSREIFTLAHELGHYLLDREDIDANVFEQESSDEEKWCNEFAFHFVLGEKGLDELVAMADGNGAGLLQKIIKFAQERHVSLRAISYHFSRKGAEGRYISKIIDEGIRQERKKRPAQRMRTIGQNSQIYSPLETEIYIEALNEGLVEEADLDEKFNEAWMKANVDEGRWLSELLNG